MTERTGLGQIEVAVLSALDELGAGPDQMSIKNVRAFRVAAAQTGLGPRYVWDVLRDLARPWRAPVSLVDFHGNYHDMGSLPFFEASWTESRLSPVGGLALMAERGRLPSLPIGIINGTVYQGGEQPPFQPAAVIEALLLLLETPSVSDDVLLDVVGPPTFPHGCEIVGDIGSVLVGDATMLSLYPQVSVDATAGRTTLELYRFPPELWAAQVVSNVEYEIGRQAEDEVDLVEDFDPLRVVEVTNITTGRSDHSRERVLIVLAEGADADEVIARLRVGVEGSFLPRYPAPTMGYDVSVNLGRPVVTLLREWVDHHREPALGDALRRLAATIRPVSLPGPRRRVYRAPSALFGVRSGPSSERARWFPDDLARRVLPRDGIDDDDWVDLSYTDQALTGVASGHTIDCTIEPWPVEDAAATGTITAAGSHVTTAFRVTWAPITDVDPSRPTGGRYRLAMTGSLADLPVTLQAVLRPSLGLPFESADISGDVAGIALQARVEAAGGGFGADTVAIDATFGPTPIALYAAMPSRGPTAVIRGTVGDHRVHLNARRDRDGSAHSGHVTGSYRGPPTILVLLLGTVLVFM